VTFLPFSVISINWCHEYSLVAANKPVFTLLITRFITGHYGAISVCCWVSNTGQETTFEPGNKLFDKSKNYKTCFVAMTKHSIPATKLFSQCIRVQVYPYGVERVNDQDVFFSIILGKFFPSIMHAPLLGADPT